MMTYAQINNNGTTYFYQTLDNTTLRMINIMCGIIENNILYPVYEPIMKNEDATITQNMTYENKDACEKETDLDNNNIKQNENKKTENKINEVPFAMLQLVLESS